MAGKRIIDVYWNIIDRHHQNASGLTISPKQYPYVYFKEKPLLNLRLVINASNAPYTELDLGSGFSYAIDSDFDRTAGSPLMMKTLGVGINVAGDFAGVNADLSIGQISVQLDANNTDYETKIGTSGEKANTKGELQVFDGSLDLVSVFQMPFRTFNLVDDNAAIPGAIETTVFFEEIDGTPAGKCLRIKNSEGVILAMHCPDGVDCDI